MKLRHKILALPTLVMVSIFAIGLFVMEYQLKNELNHRYQQQLMTVTSMALSAVDMLDDFAELETYDIMAERLARVTQTRITFLAVNGTVIGDSELPYQQVLQLDNHANRPEVMKALESGQGMSRRYSESLQKELFYFARFQEPEMSEFPYIARVAIPADEYDEAVVSLRVNFLVLGATTITAVLFFGMLTLQILNRAITSQQSVLEQRVAVRTKEITLMQTLSAMLNGAQSLDEAASVLEQLLPKLLPSYRGYISMINSDSTRLKTFVSWDYDDVVQEQDFPERCWSTKVDKVVVLPKCPEGFCDSEQCQIAQESYCVALIAQGSWIGVLHLALLPDEQIEKQDTRLMISIAEQVSMAFANIMLRDNLREQATVDSLTGLYNRRFMLEAFEKEIAHAERNKTSVAVMMLDIDYFKDFNDTFGHDAGDVVLAKVAATLKQNLRLTDISCRYGGEEFCIICPETSMQYAADVAEKMRQLISVLYLNHKGVELGEVTASIGVAVFPGHGQSVFSLLKRADEALYRAKTQGRNQVVVCQEDENSLASQ